MAMTYLTVDDRTAIAKLIVDHKYQPLLDEIAAKHKVLAQEAYDWLYPEETRKMLDDLPHGAVPLSSTLHFKVGAGHATAYFAGTENYEAGQKPHNRRRVFYKHHDHKIAADINVNQVPCIDNIRLLESQRARLKEDRKEMIKKVEATLSSYRYFEKAIAAWPEAERFIKQRWQLKPEGGAPVPAVRFQDLNAVLGLPPT